MTLYEIDNSIRQFIDQMIDSVDENGELVEVDPKQLEQLNEERRKKLESIACYIKNLSAESEALKKEEDNLKSRRSSVDKKIERLKKLLSDSLIASGDENFKTERCVVSFKKSSEVVIIDENVIDKKFMRTKTTTEPDKKLIRERIDAGEEVRGAYLNEKKNIQIK